MYNTWLIHMRHLITSAYFNLMLVNGSLSCWKKLLDSFVHLKVFQLTLLQIIYTLEYIVYTYYLNLFQKTLSQPRGSNNKRRPLRTPVLLLVINLFMAYFHYSTSQITQSMAATEDNSITATFSCASHGYINRQLRVPASSAVLACYVSLFVATKFLKYLFNPVPMRHLMTSTSIWCRMAPSEVVFQSLSSYWIHLFIHTLI